MDMSKLQAAVAVASSLIDIQNETPDIFNDMARRFHSLTLTKSERKELFLIGQQAASVVDLPYQDMNRSRFMLAAYGIPPKRIPDITPTEAMAGQMVYSVMNRLNQPEDMFSEAAMARGLKRIFGTVKITRRTGCLPS